MQIIAHRGCCGNGVENSINSLDSLPEDVDGIEVDVRLTADNIPFLYHDKTVGIKAGEARMIHKLTFSEVIALSSNPQSMAPTLDNYILECEKRNIPRIFLDIKVFDEASVAIIAKELKSKKCLDRITCLTKTEEALQVLCSVLPSTKKGMLRTNQDNLDDRLSLAERYGVDILFIQHSDSSYLQNRDIVPHIKRRGVLVGASILNKESSILLALRDGCDAVLTDHCDIFKKTVNKFMGLSYKS
jgi:glycerophosphoryl diester phosphodiesterase